MWSPPVWAQGSSDTWTPRILKSEPFVQTLDTGRESSSLAIPYLPDFSYVGYHWGEDPIPIPAGRVLNVTSFGAVPDDGQDDTEAVQDAVDRAHDIEGPVIVRFPVGRFIIREILFIERSNLVLQGSGSEEEETVLRVPVPLSEMNVPEGYEEPFPNGTSSFSWRGGVIWTRLPHPGKEQVITRVTDGRRGFHTFETKSLTNLEPGDVVQLKWYNREGRESSLLHHIYCTSELNFGSNLYEDPSRPIVTQPITIEEVEGDVVRVKEPLLHDLRGKWDVSLRTTHFLKEVGIEHLRIEFAEASYAGHHHEAGYNGLFLNDLMHSWVRKVTIENADSGILVNTSTKNITLSAIDMGGRRVHHTIAVGGYGTLVENFHLEIPAVHNPTFSTLSRYNVYSNGRIWHPKLDQHNGNHQNLFDNLALTYGGPIDDLLFRNGGSRDWRPAAGAFNTFWNLRVTFLQASGRQKVGTIGDAPYARVVGLRGTDTNPIAFSYGPNAYIEGTNRPNIAVESLHEYQRTRRLTGKRGLKLAIRSPLTGYRYPDDASVPIKVAVSGNAERIERMVFYAGDRRIGEDTDGEDGWGMMWKRPREGIHELRAVGTHRDGRLIPSEPLSCAAQGVSVWIGDEQGLLESNYPNPFRNDTTIRYAIPETKHVQLEVYNVLGRRVRTLVDEVQDAGRREVRFDAEGLASGVYFYRLQTGGFSKTGKAVIVK